LVDESGVNEMSELGVMEEPFIFRYKQGSSYEWKYYTSKVPTVLLKTSNSKKNFSISSKKNSIIWVILVRYKFIEHNW
jgi:hypothetical protein